MIINMLENLFSSDYTRRDLENCQLKGAAPTDAGNGNAVLTAIVPNQFRDDVERLKAYVGAENWIAGLKMELTLQELLSICPRERKRSDAYKKLIAYLADELEIKLIIKTKGANHVNK